MATNAQTKACSYVVGDDGLATWTDVHKNAWIGLLETHKRLTRALDAELEAEHGLTLSGVECLGRLAAADGRAMRLTELAKATGLSLSRVSRIVDTLEGRKLVERQQSPDDARVVEAHLTDDGLVLVRKAQSSHFASVQERFFEQLDGEELAVLARVFGRFVPRDAGSCTES
jgi:DNA-binding MarR family transcriptional regulator